CKYCSQSGQHNSGLEQETTLAVGKVVAAARAAKAGGALRCGSGAAWRSPTTKAMPLVLERGREVKALALESCMTLRMLAPEQAEQLAAAGLDYYTHSLDTSAEYYRAIVTTRSYQERLDTLEHVRNAGINVCAGGILGMGQSRQDRVGLLWQLANLPVAPESVPINMLVKIPGTPLAEQE